MNEREKETEIEREREKECVFYIKSENGPKRLKATVQVVLVIVVVTLLIVIGIKTKKSQDPAEDPQRRKDFPGHPGNALPLPTKPTPTEIVWLHIPKCGTSLLNTLYHYACPGIPSSAGVGADIDPIFIVKDLTVKYPMDQYCTISFESYNNLIRNHAPIYEDTKIENVFAMFRDPFSRLVSAFNWGRNGMKMDGKTPRESNLLIDAVKGKSRKFKFEMYYTFGDVLGCQTKMVVGHRCASDYTLNQADLKTAKQRIEKMRFIGITGEWNRSICLFHKQLGGKIYDVEFQNVRPGYNYTKGEFDWVSDPYDDELYRHVQHIVYRRFLQFGC